jgi:hypothetical protein
MRRHDKFLSDFRMILAEDDIEKLGGYQEKNSVQAGSAKPRFPIALLDPVLYRNGHNEAYGSPR